MMTPEYLNNFKILLKSFVFYHAQEMAQEKIFSKRISFTNNDIILNLNIYIRRIGDNFQLEKCELIDFNSEYFESEKISEILYKTINEIERNLNKYILK